MITNNYCKCPIVRVAFLLALTASLLFSSSALATTFDLSTLNGTYGGTNMLWGSNSPNSPAIVPTSSRELITFDGNGNFTDDQVINLHGNLVRLTVTGTYTVNGNGTGQMSWVGVGGLPHMRDFVIVNGGAQIMSTQDPTNDHAVAGVGTFLKQ